MRPSRISVKGIMQGTPKKIGGTPPIRFGVDAAWSLVLDDPGDHGWHEAAISMPVHFPADSAHCEGFPGNFVGLMVEHSHKEGIGGVEEAFRLGGHSAPRSMPS